MRLTTSSLPPYLESRGLVDKREAVTSEYVAGKNSNFLVQAGNRKIFAKQFKSSGIEYELLCKIERHLFKEDPRHNCELLSADSANRISVYSMLGGDNFDKCLVRSDLSKARTLTLEVSNTIKSISSGLAIFLEYIPKNPHWVVDLLSPPVEILRYASPAQLQLLEFIQANRSLSDTLSLVKEAWSTRSAVHGDIKHQNILVDNYSVFVLDWEMIQAGPPCWDHAAATAAIVVSWILSFPARGFRGAEVDTAKISPSIINAMMQIMKNEVVWDSEYIRMVSANLVKNAFEGAAGLEYIPIASVYMLQVAQNFEGELFD
ncbi:phosphotransferase [Pseudomonas sp. H3_H05]